MRITLLLLCAAFPEVSEAANSVCSSGLYGLLQPLAQNAKAQDFCAKQFPVKTVTVLVRRFIRPTPAPLNKRVAAAAADKKTKFVSNKMSVRAIAN